MASQTKRAGAQIATLLPRCCDDATAFDLIGRISDLPHGNLYANLSAAVFGTNSE